MKKIGCTALFILLLSIANAQDITHNISQREANEIVKSLNIHSTVNIRTDQLLKLAMFNILKSGEKERDLDSATIFLNQAIATSKKSASPLNQGYIALVASMLNREKGNIEQGKKHATIALSQLVKTNDYYHLGLAYLEMAQYYDYSDVKQLANKVQLGEAAVKALERSDHIEVKAFAYKSLADLYSTQAEFKKALQYINLSLKAYQSINYKELQGVYIIYTGLYSITGDYHNALKSGLEALKTAEAVKDTTMQLCEINNIVAVTLGKMQEPEKALGYYKKALEVAERYKDYPSIILITSNIGITYMALGKYKEGIRFLKSVNPVFLKSKNIAFVALIPTIYLNLYTGLKSYEEGRAYAEQLSVILARHTNDIANLPAVYDALTAYYTATKRFTEARSFLQKTEEYLNAQDHKSPSLISKNYARWFKLDSLTGNYQSALNYHIRYTKIKDSLFTETKNKQLKQLEIQYETEKKTAEIKILGQENELLSKNAELQKSNLRQANLIKDFTLVGVLLLTVILILLYRQNQARKKSNRSISQKNEQLQHLVKEKEWLLKEVHHRVKNNLHTVICLLESQAAYLENDALTAIENGQHRIYAMLMIHQKLYQSDDIKTINMAEYIPELVQTLEDSFDVSRQIQFKLNISPIKLDISQAIPLGLIINEAITNSIKYAFPNKRTGEISISMINNGGVIQLDLSDNGIGIPELANEDDSGSLGLVLIKGLSEDIDAQINFEVRNGTRITIVFNSTDLINPDGILKFADTKERFYA